MRTLQKIADKIGGTVNKLKYGKLNNKGYCITDVNNNEVLTISPSYNGFKWYIINRNGFNSEIFYINNIKELKNLVIVSSFTGVKFIQ